MKIINFGSLNIDKVYTVPHFVRAGETLASAKLREFCGGKGLNQSIALAHAGAVVYHAGCVGRDGDALICALQDAGVNTSLIRQIDEPSGHAIIQVDEGGQNCILLYGGANRQIALSHIDDALSRFEPGDILLLQNEINGLSDIIERAYQRGLRIALNPSPIDESLGALPLHKITWFVLNEIEGAALGGGSDEESILAGLRRRFPAAKIVLTLGGDGAVYDDGAIRCRHGVYRVPVADTTAAGDTFTGFFFASQLRGDTPQESLRLASIASALAVSRNGAAASIPTLGEVQNADLTLA